MNAHPLKPITVPTDWRQQLRRLVPDKPLTISEAQRVARYQATQLRTWLGDPASVTANHLMQLPGLYIRRASLRTTSGVLLDSHSSYQRGGWLVCLDNLLPDWMLRWVIAHEIKHLLDASLLVTQQKLLNQQEREATCNEFTTCLLAATRGDLTGWHRQGQPSYSSIQNPDMINTSTPEVSKDNLARREMPHDNHE